MKVTRNLPEQLILDHRPWLFSLLFGGFAFVFLAIGVSLLFQGDPLGLLFGIVGGGIGLAAFYMIAQRVQVILDRTTGTVTLRRRTLLGYSRIVHDLADLQKAVLEETRTSKGTRVRRPSLLLEGMSAGIHPIIGIHTNTHGPATAVRAINDWLDATRVGTRNDPGTAPTDTRPLDSRDSRR